MEPGLALNANRLSLCANRKSGEYWPQISGDFSDDNLTLPDVLLDCDSPVSGVTHALGASELMCLRHYKISYV